MTDFVRTIIIMSATGSILSLLLFIAKPLIRNRLPKSAQYYLWLVVIIAMLVPISQIVVLSDNQATAMPALQRVTAPVAQMPTISETVTRFVITQGEEQTRLQNIAHLADTNAPAYYARRQEIISPVTLFTTHFVRAYPFGVLIVAVWYVANYLFFSKMYRRRNLLPDAETKQLLAKMCSGRVPRLYYNQLATTPMILGVFCPMIILPDKDYSPEQLYAILSHELTHLRRKDIFIKWLTLLATALHWFNPIVWLARREIDRNCELSCDEAVIRNLDVNGKRVYGNTLIAVSANSKAPRAIASATMCEDKKNLKERLGAIMKNKKHTRIAIVLSVLLVFLTACGALALGVGSQDENEVHVETPPQIEAPSADPILYITNMNAEHLNLFDTFYEFDFLGAYANYHNLSDDDWFFTIEGEWGVVIWAEIPLHNLQVIALSHYDTEYESAAYVGNVFYERDILPAGTPFFISRFVTVGGILPLEGISFTDPSGVRRNFAIIEDRRGNPGDPPFSLLEFENGSRLWGLTTEQTPVHLGLTTADYLYASRINLDGVARRSIVTANQSPDTLAWLVEPDLPHQSIHLCNCGFFVDGDWNIIDPVTGLSTDEFHWGHGGPPPPLVYDATLGLLGNAGFGEGYHYLYGMHPINELESVLPDWYRDHTRMLSAVELVDSTMRTDMEWYDGGWLLTEDAFLGHFALMYDHQFTTTFAFHEIRIANVIDNFEITERLPFAAVRIDNLWGVVDTNGNIVIPYMFEDLTLINENTAFARFNGAYGILDISENLNS